MLFFGRVISENARSPVPDIVVSVLEIATDFGEVSAAELIAGPMGLSERAPRQLSSAITDATGAFRLEIEPDGTDQDLIVLVFEPLSATGEGELTESDAAERLLQRVTLAAGTYRASEAIVFTLPDVVLRERGLLREPIRDVAPELFDWNNASALADAISASVMSRQTVEASVAGALSPILNDTWRDKTQAREISDTVTKVPFEIRSGDYFVPATLHGRRRDAAIEEASFLSARNAGDRFASFETRELPLFLAPDRMAELGIDLASLSAQEVTLETSCGLIRAAAGGVGLTRVRTLDDVIKRLETLRNAPPPDVPPSGDDGAGPGAVDPTLEQDEEIPESMTLRLQRLVEAQLRDLSHDEEKLSDLPRHPLAKIRADLEAAELSAGPADTTAYHDIFALQMAYPEVWAEAVDIDLRNMVAMVTDVFRKAARDAGVDPDDVLETEIEDLDAYLARIGGFADALEEAEARAIPEEVRLLWPSISAHWPLMTREEQRMFAAWATPDIVVVDRDAAPRERHDAARFYLSFSTQIRADTTPGGDLGALGQARTRYAKGIEYLTAQDWEARAAGGDDEAETPAIPQLPRLRRLLRELSDQLTDPYSFEYYAENTANLGILTTYRQAWKPGRYQVGDLVGTLPLAPGETRRFEVTETRATSRSVKEMEKALRARSGETTRTSRAVSEILRRAETSTNFSMSANGSFSIGIGTIGGSNTFTQNQAEHSQATKNDFREAVVKAAHEFRNETSLEISTEARDETRSVTAGEVSNTNNEVPVTYLYYRLERTYSVSEKLHRLQPVVLVAQKLPDPSDITEAWLLRHDWILRRVLLDDTFLGPLEALREQMPGQELSLSVLRANWEAQLRMVQTLEGEQTSWLNYKRKLNRDLVDARYRERLAEAAEDAGGLLYRIGAEIGGNPLGLGEDRLEARRKMFEDNLKFAEEELNRSAEKLAAAQEALDRASRTYADAVSHQTARRTQVDQLRLHVKDNILYYMQAIWSHEPPDQRYFRLHEVKVFIPSEGTARARVRAARPGERASPIPDAPDPTVVLDWLGPPDIGTPRPRALREVADLDRVLGFKGNYMIFPLKECSFVTDHMMREYVDGYFGIRDPDPLSDFTTEELNAYRNALPEEQRDAVDDILVSRLSAPRRDQEEIIVPSDQLYIEALVGSHTLLEPFKLAHRGYDAAQAREDLRRASLENIRYGARLLQDDPMLEDPDIETRVVVRDGGDGDTNVEV